MIALHPSETCAALHYAVLHAPDDDTVRLAYADCLEESAGTVECPCVGTDMNACGRCSGSGRIPDGLAASAEFVRVGVELARRKGEGVNGPGLLTADQWNAQMKRQETLLREHEASWRRGARCGSCGGKGHYRDGRAKVICGHACHGRGWLGSLAAQLSPEEIGVTNGQEFWRHKADWSRGLIYRVHAPLEDCISPDGVVEDWAVRVRGEWPVTEWAVTDREPHDSCERPRYYWSKISAGRSHHLSPKLFAALEYIPGLSDWNGSYRYFPSAEAARHALALALGSLVTAEWKRREGSQTPAAPE